MRDYNKLISEIRMATIGVEKPSSRLLLMQLAADAIEELLAAVPKWISVEERLPESGERVLIMFKPFEDDENISIGWLTKSGFDCYDDSVYFFRSVTHWMPLPEAPKEVQDA